MNYQRRDFRSELYSKYVTTYKKFIDGKTSFNFKSEYALYKRWYLPLIKEFLPTACIIDIGCGTGHMLNFLNQEGFQNTYGIDISEEQIKLAKGKGINAEVYNIFDFLEVNKRKFDIIFALDIIEHFYKHEILDLFTGLYSLLNQNGVLIIHTPNGDGLFPQHIIYGDLTHLTIFNPNSLEQILRLTGFDEIKCYETGPKPKNIKGAIRLVLWKIIKLIIKLVRIIETGGSQKILTQDFISIAKKYIINI
jgi:2-polyprenyl-3-methyl-5-hydroxy-6-metoxy-1,4-benzoquinol methylase